MNFPLEPNRDLIMPHGWDMGFLIFAGSVMSLFVLYGLWLLAAKREPLLLMVLIGGMLGEMLEPICNVLGMAYHPEHGQMVGFFTLGRHIPLWLVLCYPWYFGAFAPVYVTENAGWSASQSILTAAVSTLFCVVLLKTFERMLFATRGVAVARQGATVKSGPEMIRGGKPA